MLEDASKESCPEIACRASAASSTQRASGPTWSSDQLKGMTPRRLTRPKVGFRPTMPQSEAGMRMLPPVSVPRAAKHWPEATEAPEPEEEPPVMREVSQGL